METKINEYLITSTFLKDVFLEYCPDILKYCVWLSHIRIYEQSLSVWYCKQQQLFIFFSLGI